MKLMNAEKALKEGTREMYKRYLSKDTLYTPKVYPFVAFIAPDRMDNECSIPFEHITAMLGDYQPQTVKAEAKFKSVENVEAYVCGVNGTGMLRTSRCACCPLLTVTGVLCRKRGAARFCQAV